MAHILIGVGFLYIPIWCDMNLEKFENLIENDIDKLTNAQLKKLYKDIDKKVKQDSYNLFVDYNIKDTNLITKLDDKLNFIQAALSFAHVSKSNPSDIMGTIKPWDNMVYSKLKNNNIIIPPAKKSEREPYMGGYVKDPHIGRSDWVLSVDLKSLYPSIIMMLNMSPEKLKMICKTDPEVIINKMITGDYDTSVAHANNYCISGNGTMYSKDGMGIIPELMEYLFTTRDEIKTEMKRISNVVEKKKTEYHNFNPKTPSEIFEYDSLAKEIDTLSDEISRLNSLQFAYKILANSGYGALGTNTFRYYKLEIAEGITATGQLAIRYIESMLNSYLNETLNTSGVDYICGIDTDSNYIRLDEWVRQNAPADATKDEIVTLLDNWATDYLEPYIEEVYLALSDYLNSVTNRLIMKREAIADCAIFRAKKNYIINVYDNEHVRYSEPVLKSQGIETKRTSTPKIVRDALEDCLKIIIKRDDTELKNTVKDFKKRYNEYTVEEIAYPRGVSDIEKWLTPEGNPATGCPKHVRAAITYNTYLESKPEWKRVYQPINSGDKIKFVDLVANNPTNSPVIAFPDELPPEFGLHDFIDRNIMYEKLFMRPLESFTSITDMNVRYSSVFRDMGTTDDMSKSLVSSTNTTTEINKPKPTKKKRKAIF